MENIKQAKLVMLGRATKEWIKELGPNEIFVFGSNLAGRHGAGAARTAHEVWGAEMGVGVGLTGRTYALPTCDEHINPLPTKQIREHIRNFVLYARGQVGYTFLVTEIGCGLAGYTPWQIAPLFPDVTMSTTNIILPLSFWEVLGNKFNGR